MATALIGLLPLNAVRDHFSNTKINSAGLQIKLKLIGMIAISIIFPVGLMFVIPQMSPALNTDFLWFIAVGAAWIPVVILMVIYAIMLAFGVDVFVPREEPAKPPLVPLAVHRRLALGSVVLVLAPWVAWLMGVWTLDVAEAWAMEHPALHFAISLPYAGAIMYPVWVLLRHFDTLANEPH